MTVTITINTDNAAFQPDPAEEVARILELTARRLTSAGYIDTMTLRDINGNTVGELSTDEAK